MASLPPSHGDEPSRPRELVLSSLARGWRGGTLLVLLCAATFFPVLRADLLAWDDALNLTQNPLYHPVTPGRVLRFWKGPWSGVYAPVTYTFWAVEVSLAEALSESDTWNAGIFHAGNLLLHTFGVLAAWRLLTRLVADPLSVWWAAAVLAVHPVRVESVAWVTETKGLLAALAATVALWAYLRGIDAERSEHSSAEAGPPLRWLLWATLAFAVALGSKPSAVGLPLALVALAAAGLRVSARLLAGTLATWCLLAVVIVAITQQAQAGATEGVSYAPGQRLHIASDALGYYGLKIIWPWPLAPDYGRTPDFVLQQGWSAIAGGALVIVGAVLAAPRLRRYGLPALLMLLAGVGPNLGFVPFEFQRFSTVADRYLYWGLLGPAWLLAVGLERVPAGIRNALGLVLVLACSVVSHRALPPWANDRALYEHTARVSPRSTLAWNGLGNLAAQQGDHRQAEVCYRRVLAISPHQSAAGYNLANLLARDGQMDEAVRLLRDVIEHEPGYVKAWRRMGELELARGELPAAEAVFRKLMTALPDDVAAQRRLGEVLWRGGKTAEAIDILRTAARESREPGLANDLAWLLATTDDDSLWNPQEALVWAQRALELAPQPSANLLDTLAAAEAASGKFEQAQATAKKAWQVAESEGNHVLSQRIEQRRNGYRERQAYRAAAP